MNKTCVVAAACIILITLATLYISFEGPKMSLIATVKACLSTINWSSFSEDAASNYHYGLLFNKIGAGAVQAKLSEQVALNTPEGNNYALGLLHFTWQFGLPNTSFIESAKTVLNQVEMLPTTHLPVVYSTGLYDWFYVTYRQYWFAYHLSRAINYLPAKWDSSLAWQELAKYFNDAGGCGILGLYSFYGGNPQLDPGSDRMYDEHLQSLDWLLKLYEADKKTNAGALSYAIDTLWTYVNSHAWNSQEGHYGYTGTAGYECEGCWMAQIAARLRALNNYSLADWTNVITDIYNRFLANGWDSPNWTYLTTRYYATIHHHSLNSERRLVGTLGAWATLHMFYQILNSTAQTAIQNLLDGSTKAWSYLLSSSDLYNSTTKQFRWSSNSGSYTDAATATGSAVLMLLGIVPQTGSLYIPIDEWSYEAGAACLSNYFKFDIDNNKITIPVKAGAIKFIYGPTLVIYTFPSDGVYEILFNSAWDKISRATKLRDLNPQFPYVAAPSSGETGARLKSTVDTIIRSEGEAVTKRKLVLLHFRDPVTGWYTHNYEESNINMLIIPKSNQRQALALGLYVVSDALAVTCSDVDIGDLIVTGNKQCYEVETVANKIYLETYLDPTKLK